MIMRDKKHPETRKQPTLFSKQSESANRLSFQNPESFDEPAEEDVVTVGMRLREAREASGLSLHQVGEILRLRAMQVQALEEGDYSRLPGQTFVTGFLRSYANLLDLDAVAIVQLYKQEGAGGLRAPSLTFPEPTTGGRMPGGGLLLGSLVLALVLLAGWFLYQESENLDFERVAELPENLAKKIQERTAPEPVTSTATVAESTQLPETTTSAESSAPASPSGGIDNAAGAATAPQNVAGVSTQGTEQMETVVVPEPVVIPPAQEIETPIAAEASQKNPDIPASQAGTEAAPTDVTTETAVAETTAADSATISASAPAPTSYPQATLEGNSSSNTQTAGNEDPDNPLPRTFGVENTSARVVLRAREESWIEVTGTEEKPIISRVLKPGDVYMAPNEPDLMLTTGNAGGLEIRVDGREIAALGGLGAILRDVPLVADSLLAGSSVH